MAHGNYNRPIGREGDNSQQKASPRLGAAQRPISAISRLNSPEGRLLTLAREDNKGASAERGWTTKVAKFPAEQECLNIKAGRAKPVAVYGTKMMCNIRSALSTSAANLIYASVVRSSDIAEKGRIERPLRR